MLKRIKSNANIGIAPAPTKSYHFRDSLQMNLEMLTEPVMLDQGVGGDGKGGGCKVTQERIMASPHFQVTWHRKIDLWGQ